MSQPETYQELRAKAAGIRAEIDRMQSDDGIEEWTVEQDAATDAMAEQAWMLEDRAAVLRATALLKEPGFAALVTSTLNTMPAGPTNLGDPGCWHEGREYWAREVCDPAERQQAATAAA